MKSERAIFTHQKLAELAGVRPSRLRYWERSGLISALVQPSMRGRGSVRLYDYTEALTVLVLASLRETISLQHIRQVVNHLRQRQFSVPEVRFALAGPRVFFQTPDGEWEDVRDPNQIVLHETLDLRPLRAKLQGAAGRSAESYGQTERRRGARGSKPLVAGTRVPVEAVQRYLARGVPVDEILEAYPTLTTSDVQRVQGAASA